MPSNTEIGRTGEEFAERHLRARGYIILERNWRYKHAEIDLIAKKDTLLVFVEVKARRNMSFGPPDTFVGRYKERLILDAAMMYMEKIGYSWEVRFDIISIFLDQASRLSELRHYEDAFF